MKCRIKRRRLVITLSLLILAAAWLACARTTDDMPPAKLLSCFAKGTDILVSNGNDIPTMQIATTKTFVMVSNRGIENPCEIAIGFMEGVKKQGGNAVIGFSFSTLSSVGGRVHSIVIYGTAVVVEPASQGNRVLMIIFRIMLMLPDSIKRERATDHGGITSRIDPGSFR